jgi:CHAD domain-containing protein
MPPAGGGFTGSGARGAETHGTESRISRLLHLAADFNATLEKCLVRAEEEPVHRVRSGSRRIQAIVETILREGGVGAKPLQQPARVWLRQLKRFRRAAAPVRDLDVHRKLLKKPLAGWIESSVAEGAERAATGQLAGPGVAEPGIAGKNGVQQDELGAASAAIPEAGRLHSQAARLADWLKDERKVRADALEKQLEKHRQRLEESEIAFLAAADLMRAPREKAERGEAMVAMHDFARLSDATPVLDASNLHEFRKSVKKARYVAESSRGGGSSQTVAGALTRIQDAIGLWHDWLCLTEEAQTALGDDGAELTSWLAIETNRHFTHALAVTERIRGELLGEWLAAQNKARQRQTGTGPPQKLPSRAIAGAVAKKSRA